MNVIRPVAIGDGGSFSRSSPKNFFYSDGSLRSCPANIPAFQYDLADLTAAPTALLELAATNSIRNNTMQGAAAGTPGTLPTGWAVFLPAGISRTIANGGENGIDYIDIRFFGTASAAGQINISPETSGAAAVAGQSWVSSLFAKVVSGSLANLSFKITNDQKTSGGTFVTGGPEASVTPTLSIVALRDQRYETPAAVVTSGTVATITPILYSNVANGAVIDVTLRIGLPQLEQGGSATSPIKTAGAAVIRAADVITGTGLVYSNVPEEAPPLYSGATTYAWGATASVAGAAGRMTVYQSLQDGNLNHTPASSPSWWTAAATTYQTYSAGATYGVGDMVIDPVGHLVYESLVAANTGNVLTDETKWAVIGSTNRWAAFDDVVGTSATMNGPVLMLLAPGPIDSLGMLNIGAQSSTVAVIDPSSMTTVFSKTTDLTDDESITDYDAYFFEDEVTVSDLYTDSLPQYYSGILSLALTGVNGASIGVAKAGSQFDLGAARYGLKVGFISYTRKVTDDKTGYISAKKGNTSKRMTVTTMIDNAVLDKTVRVMQELDGIPTVYVGAGNLFTSMIQFSFCKSFDVEIQYLNNSLCSFEQEGLI